MDKSRRPAGTCFGRRRRGKTHRYAAAWHALRRKCLAHTRIIDDPATRGRHFHGFVPSEAGPAKVRASHEYASPLLAFQQVALDFMNGDHQEFARIRGKLPERIVAVRLGS